MSAEAGTERRGEGLSGGERAKGAAVSGASARERKGEVSNKPSARRGSPLPRQAPTLAGAVYVLKAEPGHRQGSEDAREWVPTCPFFSLLSELGFGRSLKDWGRESEGDSGDST